MMLELPNKLSKIYMLSENNIEYKNVLKEVIIFNKNYWKTMTLNDKINLKSWYPLTNSTCGRYTPTIFHILHYINLEFCNDPNI